ncbi:MAG TPA: hypothetical protein H9702_03755 [Candidatus Merdibacter merdavium]|uniref:Uncharacterized protein n=1 Tax=Candidatus Merdibacter merdavium TaxID=2838692 RepID=A0A9D2NRX1_9FIRM|nr:hypothetical protein [Candidatus Merdibacter merdavium]
MSDVVIMVTALVVALFTYLRIASRSRTLSVAIVLVLLGAALMFGQPLIALFAILLGLLGYVVAEVEKT